VTGTTFIPRLYEKSCIARKRRGVTEASKRDQRGRLWGKVARVLSTRQLVISLGYQDGVVDGMVFAVLNPRALHIPDPDNLAKEIGSFELPKVLVKATSVAQNASIARTFRSKLVGGGIGSLAIPDIFQPTTRVYDSLAVDKGTARELEEGESYINVGDPVVEMPEETAKERKEAAQS
jgi:hypothetical protein